MLDWESLNGFAFGVAYSMSVPVEEAKDIAQEAVVRLWQRPSYYEQPRAAIRKIARNLVIDRYRESRRLPVCGLNEAITAEERHDSGEHRQALQRIEAAIGRDGIETLCDYSDSWRQPGRSNADRTRIHRLRKRARAALRATATA